MLQIHEFYGIRQPGLARSSTCVTKNEVDLGIHGSVVPSFSQSRVFRVPREFDERDKYSPDRLHHTHDTDAVCLVIQETRIRVSGLPMIVEAVLVRPV